MKTAGVVLDFYDDPNGAGLKRAFPTAAELPESIKTAHILTPEEHDVLRNEAYALILRDEGKTFRKFACVDEGNTILSAVYFEQNADKLPAEAIKVAAMNLASFCAEFGLEPTPFIKMAAEDGPKKPATSGVGKQRDPGLQPLVGDEADWAARTNLVSIRGGADSGRVIPTANQMKTAGVSEVMKKVNADPGFKAELAKANGGKEKAVVLQKFMQKHGGVEGGGATLTDDKKDNPPSSKNPAKLNTKDQSPKPPVNKKPSDGPGAEITGENRESTDWPKVANMVDVSGKQADTFLYQRQAEKTALDGRYSLDSYGDVVKAVQYFDENWVNMDPSDRHQYAVKTAARAEELGIASSEMLNRYGSTEYSPDVEAHLSARKANCDREHHPMFDTLKEKRSSIEPETFAELLKQADTVAGLNWYYGNGTIFDPYLATFGGMNEKQAAAAWRWTGRVGDTVNQDQLHKLVREGRKVMMKYFSHEIVNGLQKDPITVFESLPDDSKVIISRLANGEFDGLPTN